jgi:hypothetical protein
MVITETPDTISPKCSLKQLKLNVMRINSFFKQSILFQLILLLIISCSEQEPETVAVVKKTGDDKVLQYIKDLGFSESSIQEFEDYYLVEGDISFQKNMKLEGNNGGRTDQAVVTTGLVSSTNVIDILVGVDASVPSSGTDNWRTEIQQAISDWNSVNGSIVHFNYTSSATPVDILVTTDGGAFYDNVLASAEFPSSGNAGWRIRLNLDFNGNQSMTSSQKRYNMVHELGHCVGLRHTNWIANGESSAWYVPGTPCTDNSSVMNGATALNSWNGFSKYDIVAAQILYPITRPANTSPFFRYYQQSSGDHFYTKDYSELGCGANGYNAEGLEGYVYDYQAPGTVPLHRYNSTTFGDHYYTLNNIVYPNYTYEGVAGYVYPTQVSGSVPMYMYYNSTTADHFYTTSPALYPGYTGEGIVWYVLP